MDLIDYMKKMTINIRNLLPYLLLIVIYFFFVNLEAKKENMQNKTKKENYKKEKVLKNEIRNFNNNKVIEIPVIPYKN
tara:strand:+ start:77 stop:310 length:234 start_codon:yes stop_codon:yes gene_type:complete